MLRTLSARRSLWIVLLLALAFFCAPAWPSTPAPDTPKVAAASEAKAEKAEASGEEEHGDHGVDGSKLGLWLVIPFAGLLLAIALCPLWTPKFWHHHYGKTSAAFALATIGLMMAIGEGGGGGFTRTLQSVAHVGLLDYVPFMILLAGLFSIAGGIYIRGDFRGTPFTNTMFLLVGTLVASWVGTTGASMLMIQPVLRANKKRKKKAHIVVFFIFLVSNIGGSLTPLGDPPLFLGFLHGVDFFWTFHLLPETTFMAGSLLVIFFILDSVIYKGDALPPIDPTQEREKFGIAGAHNLLLLGGLIGAILLGGWLDSGPLHNKVLALGDIVEIDYAGRVRDGLILLMAGISVFTTRKAIRQSNNFSWGPIKEVAKLFAGIFACMVPALAILSAGPHGALDFVVNNVEYPWQYFWASGTLSSFLDNAPTYLVFFQTAHATPMSVFAARGMSSDPVSAAVNMPHIILVAISAGAVFMGANSYIGNAPNFMVKAIAEENDVKMPSFIGYMLWSVGILIPLFILLTLIFMH